MVLADILKAGLDNPECSFYVGSFMGQWLTFRLIFALAGIYFIFRAADVLAFTPLLRLIKRKIRGKNDHKN